MNRKFDDDEFIPIGTHCKNMEVLVLNEDNQLVAQGESGELCVRGTGVRWVIIIIRRRLARSLSRILCIICMKIKYIVQVTS